MIKKLLAITALTIISASSIYAQASAPLQTSFRHQIRNSDNGNGSVAVDRFDLRGGVPLINKNGSLLALGFRYAQDRYDFNNSTADWETVRHTTLGIASRWKINEKWLWANYATAAIAAEEGADKDQALVYNLLSIAEYKVNDRLTIGPGIGIGSEIDRGLNAFPIVAIKWQVNDQCKIASGPSDVAPTGANIYFEYTPEALQNKWIFTTGFSYSNKHFKLDRNTTTKDTSGEERLVSAYIAASYQYKSGIKISAVTGLHLFQSFTIYDNRGNELSKANLDDAPFVGLSVGCKF